MATVIAQIVGSHFRPPAKQVLAHLPGGAELRLVPEPENPYDPKAVQVHVRPGAVPESQHSSLDAMMLGTGTDLGELLQAEWLQLGYIADSDGKMCKSTAEPGNREVAKLVTAVENPECWERLHVTLGFNPEGKPVAIVSTVEAKAKADPEALHMPEYNPDPTAGDR